MLAPLLIVAGFGVGLRTAMEVALMMVAMFPECRSLDGAKLSSYVAKSNTILDKATLQVAYGKSGF